MANTKVTSAVIADGAITPSKIASGDFYFDTDTLYIDSTNNRVGIGQSSPQAYLHVYGTNAEQLRLEGNDEYTYLRFQGTPSGGSSSALGDIGFGNYSGTAVDLNIANRQTGALTFHTGTSFTERLRITSGGDSEFKGNIAFTKQDGMSISAYESLVIQINSQNNQTGRVFQINNYTTPAFVVEQAGNARIGTTGIAFSSGEKASIINSAASGQGLGIRTVTAAAQCLGLWNSDNGGVRTFINFAVSSGGGGVGSITSTGSTTAYNTTSDYRLKENVNYDFNALERVAQLKPARFNFIADADTTVDGFLAHEVQDIVPEAITGVKDEMQEEEYEVTPAELDEEGNVVTEAVMGTREVPKYQGIDQSKLVPLLTKAIQEQQTIIDDLKARIETLENA